jgi:hypothetical protein
LKYLSPRALHQSGALAPFQVGFSSTGQTVIISGPASNVNAVEAFLKKLDVRPRNVEATFYIVAASSKSDGTVPSDLEPVVKQLRSAFNYAGFRLLETAVARSREGGELRTSGVLPMSGDPERTMKRQYTLSVDRINVSAGEKGNVIRFDRLQFNVQSPDNRKTEIVGKPEFTYSGVTSDLDVREGQKVVVGKSNFDGPEGTFFLIVTAKLVD